MSKNNEKAAPQGDVTQDQAEDAVRTLLRWAGDDPTREGLLETPQRVTKAFGEFFKGYEEDAAEILDRVFEEVAGYENAVCEPERLLLRDVGDLDAESAPVAQRLPDLGGRTVYADDDPDLLDPSGGHLLDHVEEDRFVGDRHELLGARVGDRPEPGAGTAGEDQAFHRTVILDIASGS